MTQKTRNNSGLGTFLALVCILFLGWHWFASNPANRSPQPYAPIEDPEEEMQNMGKPSVETVIAGKQSDAIERCRKLAELRGKTYQGVQHHTGNQWNCIFY